jgi:trimeric autotransporter adhesin
MADKEKILLTGFVAQEVEQAAAATGFDFSGVDKPKNDSGLYALRYAEFVVPLVKAMQEQQQLITDLQKKVQSLQDQADVTILMRETFAAGKIAAYPDPVANNMTVTINTQSTGNGTLQILDSGGKLVKQMNIAVQQGNNSINLSLPTLAAGYYTLKMDWGNTMHKQISFVKAAN